jgi:indole-3-glycerol phosphate synthase
MSSEHLGVPFDIHGGGADLVFPHHENEIAQAGALYREKLGGKPWVKYWLHNGFITVRDEKMSKSLGNFVTLKELVGRYTGSALRMFFLGAHYRSPIEYAEERLAEAARAVDRIYNCLGAVDRFIPADDVDRREEIVQRADEAREEFKRYMDDDFNTAGALGSVFGLVDQINSRIDQIHEVADPGLGQAANILRELIGVLGLPPESRCGARRARPSSSPSPTVSVPSSPASATRSRTHRAASRASCGGSRRRGTDVLLSIWRDFRAIKNRDPAARWFLDRLLTSSGWHALVWYRVAHIFWVVRLRLLARLLSSIARLLTGVEIHPGARIGSGTVIDHGMGVVIGETTILHNNVTLFQGVTLGGTGKSRGKRHPTVEEGVVIGAGAQVLGDITIGANARVGAGSVVVRDVPAGATVVGVPGRVVQRDGVRVVPATLDHGDLPDPIREALEELSARLRQDEERFVHERSVLDEIEICKRKEVMRLKIATSPEKLREIAAAGPEPRDFKAALAAPGLSLIGEIKRASPSAGIIREEFNVEELAGAYERGGARALSVLTDKCYFKGALEYLTKAREATALPALRKDFILDEAQVFEARAAGADAVLLIVRMLGQEELCRLSRIANSIGLATLVEVHDRRELAKALRSDSPIIGVNNRDLATFETDITTTLKLAEEIPEETVLVSESGIRTREDLTRLESAGVDAVLIGETFMRAGDVEAKVKELFG